MNPKKKNKLLIISLLIFIPSIICLIIASFNIAKWSVDNNNTKLIMEQIEDIVEVEVSKGEPVIIEQKEEIKKEDPYWDYIKMDLINVDFNSLKSKNSETVGWIQVNGTNINYPFVQTSNNSFYLTHSFDKKTNGAGWVFMDYRNDISNIDKNTILYAHSRLNKTMFGSLRNILTSGWLNNKNNYVIKLSTEYENTLWQVFSVYRIPTTNDYLKVEFTNEDEFLEWGKMLLNRSAHNFNTAISKEDYILTLSTCGDNDTKVVLHAKLIKKETR